MGLKKFGFSKVNRVIEFWLFLGILGSINLAFLRLIGLKKFGLSNGY